ncbi:hypothetical protein CAAN3_06S06084 [[Candida] anglica]
MSLNPLIEASGGLYKTITKSLSDQKTTTYNNGNWSLEQLDHWKNEQLPTIVLERYKEHGGDTWLIKEELELLMDWKLAKGKFRPTLPKLIRQNEPDSVKTATQEGFKVLIDFYSTHSSKKNFWKNVTSKQESEYISAVKDALKKTSTLRGVGPATASLILSLLSPIVKSFTPPFFSDESFIYFVVEPSRKGTKIKYNVKEYVEEYLPVLIDILKSNPDVDMNVLEKGAWSIKSYDIGKLDILADIKLPFNIEPEILEHYVKNDDEEEEEEEDEEEDEEDEENVKIEEEKEKLEDTDQEIKKDSSRKRRKIK